MNKAHQTLRKTKAEQARRNSDSTICHFSSLTSHLRTLNPVSLQSRCAHSAFSVAAVNTTIVTILESMLMVAGKQCLILCGLQPTLDMQNSSVTSISYSFVMKMLFYVVIARINEDDGTLNYF